MMSFWWMAGLQMGLAASSGPDMDVVPAEPVSPHCLTGEMADLRERLPDMSPGEQEAALLTLEPWRAAWAARGTPPPVSCIGRYGENYVEGEHFSVEWDGNTIDEETAEQFLSALEYSWGIEVDELGWTGPTGASNNQILVYVADGGSAGAYTSVTQCSRGGISYMPYIVAYEGSFRAGSWYKTMAAHEFNHASQFYYGGTHEFYFWEATATWVEEYVYESHNDWADSIAYGYSQQPHIAMNASDQDDAQIFWHMYAMAVWNFYLDEHVGGHDLVLEIWQNATRQNGDYSYWMPDAIADVGLDFAETYAGFMATVAFMDFRERRYFMLPERHDTASSLPASGDDGRNAPQSLGQNFIVLSDGAAENGEMVQFTFDGQDGVEWMAVLARGEENDLDEYVTLELDEDGFGTGQIKAKDGKDIVLIVSPIDDSAVGFQYNWSRADEFAYTWSAEVVVPEEITEDDELEGASDKEDRSGTCATGAGLAGPGWLLALALAGWRRRMTQDG